MLFNYNNHLFLMLLSTLLPHSSSMIYNHSTTTTPFIDNNSIDDRQELQQPQLLYYLLPSLSSLSNDTSSSFDSLLHDDPTTIDEHPQVTASSTYIPVALYVCVSLLIFAVLFAFVAVSIVFHRRRKESHRFPDSTFYAASDNESRAWDSLSFVSCAETNVTKLQSWESLSDDSYLTSLDEAIASQRASIVSSSMSGGSEKKKKRNNNHRHQSNGDVIGSSRRMNSYNNNSSNASAHAIVYSLPNPTAESTRRNDYTFANHNRFNV